MSRFFSFLFSLLVHLFLILIFGATWMRWQHHHQEKKSPTTTPPEVVFDLSTPPQERPYVDTSSTKPLDKPPEQTQFQSYENSAAASELPPSGKAPLPSQQGREKEALSFHQTDHVTETKNQASIASAPPPAIPQESLHNESDLAHTTAEPVPMPVSSQPIMGHLSSAAKNNAETSHLSMIRGSISNKGPASVATEATPIGRYKKKITEAICLSWHHAVDHRIDLLSVGTATVSFCVTKDAKIESLQLLSNSSDQSFADCCLKSIMEATLPPIPADIATTLQNKKLNVEYSFTICAD